ncbi:hypothetical protein BDB01DRAFT_807715 [Pilobolus umbonatus]|nr:hypothetical protein BDB01DRAFT_807715 [Pilobolus umbonatus]
MFKESSHNDHNWLLHENMSYSFNDHGDKKEKLEKNREAALRCRQKKKKWIKELEDCLDVTERKNKELVEQVNQLKDESIYLRNLLLTHGNCDCAIVQNYLCQTSKRLAEI